VIATVVGLAQFSLTIGCATKLAAPNNKCILQQPALTEILDQTGGGLIGVPTLASDRFR
jgi:hypothetical protein